MTIQDLVDIIQNITLNKINAKSFYVGNTWDHSNSKGDIYPAVWLEFPILVEYSTVGVLTKTYTFSLDVLALPKLDDTVDEMHIISHCEELADELLYWLKRETQCQLIDKPSGLTVKAINADVAAGIRLDIKVYTGRVCPQ